MGLAAKPPSAPSLTGGVSLRTIGHSLRQPLRAATSLREGGEGAVAPERQTAIWYGKGVTMDHGMKAAELFLQGYNCAQSVAVAFSDVTGLDEKTAARMVSAFGGGMGRLREVCGAVSGMFFVLSWLYGYDEPGDDGSKKRLYTEVQALAAAFREENGSIVCREILKNPPSDPNPTPRTAEFYKKRPCAKMVLTAGRLMDAFIAAHPLEETP